MLNESKTANFHMTLLRNRPSPLLAMQPDPKPQNQKRKKQQAQRAARRTTRKCQK
jgi:hypothetical protein